MERLVLYPKDIAYIIGKKRGAVSRLCIKIRSANNKSEDIPITVNEFCKFMNIDKKLVLKSLR